MLSNDSLGVVLFISLLMQLFYIKTLVKLNECLFEKYKVKEYYFYFYPVALTMYYIFISKGLFTYSPYLNVLVMLVLPLFSFALFITNTLFLLSGSRKMLSLFEIREKYFFLDTGGIGIYVFLIAMFFGTYTINFLIISLFIISAITHWIFVHHNYKFLKNILNKKI